MLYMANIIEAIKNRVVTIKSESHKRFNEKREIPSRENLLWLMRQIHNKKVHGEREDICGNFAKAYVRECRLTVPEHTILTWLSILEVEQLIYSNRTVVDINSVFEFLEYNPAEIKLLLTIDHNNEDKRMVENYRILEGSNQNNLVFKKEGRNNILNGRFEYHNKQTPVPESTIAKIINQSYKIAFNLFLRKGVPIPIDPLPNIYKSLTNEFPISTNGKLKH